jgi:hypothetical protein
MIYVFIGLGMLFILIGFIVNEKNAKYLLSGYNTMSEEDRKKVDLKKFIPYFRKFHIILGVTFFLFGAALTYFISKNAGGIFLTVYPILAYIYFIVNSSKYAKGLNSKWNKFGIAVLIATFVFVVGLLIYGFSESEINYNTSQIEFEGIYGEILTPEEIESITMTDELPDIKYKKNGFALGSINKGYFATEKGETVKLILNSAKKPIILFTKTNGKKIYFVAQDEPSSKILNHLKDKLPNIEYK